jgi:hypothetical protein
MTILEYIRSKVRVTLSDENVSTILLDRGLTGSEATDAGTLTAQMRELLYADALMLIATSPNTMGGESYEHGGFSQKTSSEVIHSLDRYTQMAMDIYKKWEDDRYVGYDALSWIDNEY